MFNAPIPGMSLTSEPKKYPWERPPELYKAEDVANYYLDKLSDKDTIKAILDFLVIGELTLVQTVEGIMRIGVSKGLHTIDAGLLVAPLVHKTIKLVADSVGIDYEEGLVDKKAKEENDKIRKEALMRKFLGGINTNQPTEVESEVAPVEAEPMLEQEPQGLIARRK